MRLGIVEQSENKTARIEERRQGRFKRCHCTVVETCAGKKTVTSKASMTGKEGYR